jgi:hypothetical protein
MATHRNEENKMKDRYSVQTKIDTLEKRLGELRLNFRYARRPGEAGRIVSQIEEDERELEELRPRAQNGTYKHSDGECGCGHSLGNHDAERVKVQGQYFQECQAEGCDCQVFKKKR